MERMCYLDIISSYLVHIVLFEEIVLGTKIFNFVTNLILRRGFNKLGISSPSCCGVGSGWVEWGRWGWDCVGRGEMEWGLEGSPRTEHLWPQGSWESHTVPVGPPSALWPAQASQHPTGWPRVHCYKTSVLEAPFSPSTPGREPRALNWNDCPEAHVA